MRDISIIMPLYNAEKYLEEAIGSLINQTFNNFELLCINDCSTDGTSAILEGLCLKDARIRVINNSVRQGAAISRNIGITEAKGKYLIFLDGDDVFDEDLLKESFNTIEHTNADIVLFDYMHVNSQDVYIKRKIHHGDAYIARYCRDTFCIKELQPHEFIGFSAATCNKLYRRSFINSNNVIFQSLPSSNDVFFSLYSLLVSNKIIVLNDDRVMVYARDHQEVSRISRHRDPMCAYEALEHLLKNLMNSGALESVTNHYFYQLIFFLKGELYRNRLTEVERHFYDFLQKEGIARLLELAGEYYQSADAYVKEQMQAFVNKTYQSRWFECDNLLNLYLHSRENEVKEVLEKYQLANKKIGVWGAGRNGKAFIQFCNKHEIQIDMVVDADIRKEGTVIGGYTISSPESIHDRVDVFIVTSAGIIQAVKKDINKKGLDISLEDINMIVGIY